MHALHTAGQAVAVSAWDSEEAFEQFLATSQLAQLLQSGWQARLRPIRSWGAWSALADLPKQEPHGNDGPIAVLTLGNLRIGRVIAFLRTSAAAERQAVMSPGLIAGTALARPPHFVATFSIWRDVDVMREYVLGRDPGQHRRAIEAHSDRPFHHESVFIRLKPLGSRGAWNGHDPLSEPTGGSAQEQSPNTSEGW